MIVVQSIWHAGSKISLSNKETKLTEKHRLNL